MLVDSGYKIKIVDIGKSYWSDVGHAWQVLDVNRHLSKQLVSSIEEDSTIKINGSVSKGFNSVIKTGCHIEGPVIIGNNCVIEPNCYLGPNTVISDNCVIGHSTQITDSIVMSNTNVGALSHITNSIIGTGVNIDTGFIVQDHYHDREGSFIMTKISGNLVNTGVFRYGVVIGDRCKIGARVTSQPGSIVKCFTDVEPGSTIYL
jgi:NDP-sugar pyrophosphorylase family protein